ncbi:hypothetical protein KEM56_005464, partial [Ascosphaera pollenicola]
MEESRVRFTTGGDRNSYAPPVGDDYFLASNDKIRYFFEPSAFNAHNKLDRAPHLAVNKIGHAVHAHSTRFLAATLFHQNIEIAHDLGFRDPRVLQSMIICKQPGIGGAVPPHKDSEFLYTDPPSAVGFWIAMENATQQNGGLGFWKGSHKRSPVTRRFVRKQDGSGTEFIPWQGTGMPRGMEMQPGVEEYQTCDDDFELVNANAGDLVLIHGNVLHASQQNLSDRSRFAYTFHVIEGEEEYDARNWLQMGVVVHTPNVSSTAMSLAARIP